MFVELTYGQMQTICDALDTYASSARDETKWTNDPEIFDACEHKIQDAEELIAYLAYCIKTTDEPEGGNVNV